MTVGLEEVDNILDPEIEVPAEVEPDLVDILPRGYLSPSQINMYLNCAHAWELAYVHGKQRKTVARMFQGIFVHEATEAVLKERLSSGILPSVEMATDTFSDAFENGKKHIEDWENEDEGAVKDTGIRCTKAYYDEAAPDATPIAVEKKFATVIRSADGKVKLPILGKIDSEQVQTHTDTEYQEIRQKLAGLPKSDDNFIMSKEAMLAIRKPLRIHDLKVTTDKWNQNDLDNDLQFILYAGAEHIPDVQVDQVVKGRAKTPRPRYEKLTGIITNEQVEHATAVVEGVARGIALGHFPMTNPGNWWCSSKWCSMWRHCRGKK